jgi:hypothetical protein
MKKELSIKTRPLTTKEIVKFIKEELSDQFIEELILRELNFNNIYFEYTYLKLKDYYESMLPDVEYFPDKVKRMLLTTSFAFGIKLKILSNQSWTE